MRAHPAIAALVRAGQVSILALLMAAGWRSEAGAVDIDNDGLTREDTIAYQENMRRWDNRVYSSGRKDQQPEGVRIGNYLVNADLALVTSFDDNVFATKTDKKSDVRVDIVPVVRMQSQFARHALDFAFGGRAAQYAEYDSYNQEDVFGSVVGALHFDHAHTMSFSALSEIDHDDALNPDRPSNAREPTRNLHNRLAFGFKRDAGRLWAAVGAKAESWNYHDVRAFDGSIIDQDIRDLQVLSANLRMGYRFSPGYELQAQVRGLRQITPGSGELNRDANGWEIAAGLVGELNPIVRWRLFGGYAQRYFDRAELGTTGSYVAEAEVKWLASAVWNVSAGFRRELQDDAGTSGASARVDNKAYARLEYEVLRNLLFTIQGEYRVSDYIGVDQTDHLYVGLVGLQYQYTKNWAFQLSWESQNKLSDLEAAEFTRNRFWLGGKLRF